MKKREKMYIRADSKIGDNESKEFIYGGTKLEVDLDTGQLFIPKNRLEKFKKNKK